VRVPVRCAVRPNSEPPYLSEPTFPNVSMPPGPVEPRTADRASARAETGVRGGREDAPDEMDALDSGRPCTRAGVDAALGMDVDCDSCGVGTGDEVAWPMKLFDAKGLFELGITRSASVVAKKESGTAGLPERSLLWHERGLLGSLQLRGLEL
jgi:hypothetical protein